MDWCDGEACPQVPAAEKVAGDGDGGVAEAAAVDSEAQPEEPEGGEQRSQADSKAPPEGAEAEDTLGDVVRRSNPHVHVSHFLVVTAIVVTRFMLDSVDLRPALGVLSGC